MIIRTARFYEGLTRECEWGESDGVEYELKLQEEFKNWLDKHGGRDGWQLMGVTDEYSNYWQAYDDARAGVPVGLLFWFGDPSIAVLAKLTWHTD